MEEIHQVASGTRRENTKTGLHTHSVLLWSVHYSGFLIVTIVSLLISKKLIPRPYKKNIGTVILIPFSIVWVGFHSS